MTTYIAFRNKTHLVAYNLESLLLYFDYFCNDIQISLLVSNNLLKKIAFIVLRKLVIIAYYCGLFKLMYPILESEDDCVLLIKGKGEWPNKIKLTKNGNKLTIIKKVHNRRIYLNEKRFYETYKDKSNVIQLPKHVFKGNNTIIIEFVKGKTLERLINDGTFSLNKTLDHFTTIEKELVHLYKTSHSLIHGDLFLSNIIFKKGKYFLVDFSDSLIESYYYDLYILLYSISEIYGGISFSSKKVLDYKLNDKPFYSFFVKERHELENIEKRYHSNRQKKLPTIYK